MKRKYEYIKTYENENWIIVIFYHSHIFFLPSNIHLQYPMACINQQEIPRQGLNR
jgi:hypothetical protein